MIDCLGGSLPPMGGMVVGGGSSLQGSISGGVGLGCGCVTGCNLVQ